MIDDEACKSISPCNRRALAKCELRQDSRDEEAVICDSIEHSPVGAIIYGGEEDFELNHPVHGGLSHDDDGDEGYIVHVVVLIHKPVIG